MQTPYCDTCTSTNSFIHRHSDSYKIEKDFDIFQINYGSGSVLAFQAWDTVCLDQHREHCAANTKFGNVVMQQGLDGLQADGLVGLAPSPHKNMQGFTSELFIEKLKKAGAVDDAVFSLMINSDDNVDSKITLGGYNSEKFGKEGSRINWHPLKPREVNGKYDHWRLDLNAIYFGDNKVTNTIVDSVIVDSGTSLLLMPEAEF